MRDDDLDRLLSGRPLPDPGPAFTRAVMETVRREAEAPAPIPFPWIRLASGLSLSAVAIVAFAVATEPPEMAAVPDLPDGTVRPMLLAAASVFLSWLTLRLTAIFTGARA